MTATLLRLGFAGWRRRLLPSVLTFLLVAAGAGCFALSVQLREVADDPWVRTFDATNGGHLLAAGDTPEVGALADVDGVTASSGPFPSLVTSLQVGASTYGLRTYGMDELPTVERPLVTDGRWVRAQGEVVLERSFARVIGAEVGDRASVRTVDGALDLEVVGLAVGARESAYPDSQPGEGFVGRADLASIQPDDGTWSWVSAARVADLGDVPTVATAALGALPDGTFVRTYESRLADATEADRTTAVVLRTFAVVLLVFVALVLVTLVSTRVTDRASELGLLKAVGCTPRQVAAVVLLELVLIGAAAGLAGGVAARWLGPLVVRDSSELLGTVPVHTSWTSVVTTVSVTVGVVTLAAGLAAWRLATAGVLRSLDAHRDVHAPNGLVRALPLTRPLPLALAVKQLAARPWRSLAVAAALSVTVMALVAGLAFEATSRNEDRAERADLADRASSITHGGDLAPSGPDPVTVVDAAREQVRPLVHTFNAVLVTVAVVNLLATATLSVRRRSREIAVTRAMGFTPEQVRRSVFCADGLLGLAASLVGIPLGLAMFAGVYRIVNGDLDLAVRPPIWQLALLPALCVVAVLVVVSVPAGRAAGRSVVDALRDA